MSMKWILVLLLLQLSCYFSSGRCGKVLVWPVDYSHWINIKTILDELAQRGHEVTVLKPSPSVLLDPNKSPGIKFETFPTSISKDEYEMLFTNELMNIVLELAKYPSWKYFSKLQEMSMEESDFSENICRDAVLNKTLVTKLKESRFDVILADALWPCGELLAELLEVPFLYTHRVFLGYTYEKYSGGLLFPPSYVPVIMSQLTDKMTFMERVKNMLYVLYFDFWFQNFNEKKWDQFYSEVLGRPTKLTELMGKADMWLIRTYWDVEFPRPLLPNVDFIGGLHCRPAKPLPKEMEDFVQSSGEEGVVVFSLGSMISNLPEERANVIASALARLPQKVLWRYNGKKPDTLGPNTQLYNWIPQNDLLGHPKTKAFITHGGTNGIYEAIHHGVPIVGLPLFGDQFDNIVHIEAKGAAIKLDLITMSSSDLLNALDTVIYDPSYKENAMRLSRIHHDQPTKPLDRAVFWVEYVMRHKGAKHLRVAAHDLTWYQYYCLDVIGFLLVCVAAAVFIIIKCGLFFYWKFVKTVKKSKRE
ncbi:UDP-glucuronosyltransferase 2B4-like isoform X1 [Lepus europaeus]|uniref:UDP-glucuronosyltransferase 2B4-like isoform X1 n=2 Tax=Lepus europaeus TaxID=9983 RepID=UPI002B4854C7|nr:UDP-glucuronosyltransferase 2B4-like isoform X1 [Lepus europaeus]XP_062054753.1 UDP-glucuronosyltransferase 2B4-like isoform X1 [Lepus europaeus]